MVEAHTQHELLNKEKTKYFQGTYTDMFQSTKCLLPFIIQCYEAFLYKKIYRLYSILNTFSLVKFIGLS